MSISIRQISKISSLFVGLLPCVVYGYAYVGFYTYNATGSVCYLVDVKPDVWVYPTILKEKGLSSSELGRYFLEDWNGNIDSNSTIEYTWECGKKLLTFALDVRNRDTSTPEIFGKLLKSDPGLTANFFDIGPGPDLTGPRKQYARILIRIMQEQNNEQ